MSATTAGDIQAPGAAEPNHGLRIFIIWLPIAVVADILLYFVYGPHMPPGRMSDTAAKASSSTSRSCRCSPRR